MIDEDDEESYYDSEEWDELREKVLEESDGICQECGEPSKSLHVHHVFGLRHRVFRVLCPECHAEHHGNDEILVYQSKTPRCKFCGKEIRWLKTDGRWVPFEPKRPNDFCNHHHHCERMR